MLLGVAVITRVFGARFVNVSNGTLCVQCWQWVCDPVRSNLHPLLQGEPICVLSSPIFVMTAVLLQRDTWCLLIKCPLTDPIISVRSRCIRSALSFLAARNEVCSNLADMHSIAIPHLFTMLSFINAFPKTCPSIHPFIRRSCIHPVVHPSINPHQQKKQQKNEKTDNKKHHTSRVQHSVISVHVMLVLKLSYEFIGSELPTCTAV
jgi:hypothetical protein